MNDSNQYNTNGSLGGKIKYAPSLINNYNSFNYANVFTIIFVYFLLSRTIFFLESILTGFSFPKSLCRWDCGWYLTIIESGYQAHPSSYTGWYNVAFFPLYPLTVKLFNSVFPFGGVTSGVIISSTAIIFGAYFCCIYSNITRKNNLSYIILFITFFGPYSFYFSSVYTESFFFLLMSACLIMWNTNRYFIAGVFAALLSGTRSIGVFMSIYFLVDFLQKYRLNALIYVLRKPTALLACFVAPLGLFIYMIYLHHLTGDALAFSRVEYAWGREIGNPFSHLINGFSNFDIQNIYNNNRSQFFLSFLSLLGLIIVASLLCEKRYSEFCISAFFLFIPLSTGIESMPRYIIGCPIVIIQFSSLLSRFPKAFIYFVLILLFFSEIYAIFLWLNSSPLLT